MLLFSIYIIAAIIGSVVDALAIPVSMFGWKKEAIGYSKVVKIKGLPDLVAHVIQYEPGKWALAVRDGLPLSSAFGTASFWLEVTIALPGMCKQAHEGAFEGASWITPHLVRLSQGYDTDVGELSCA